MNQVFGKQLLPQPWLTTGGEHIPHKHLNTSMFYLCLKKVILLPDFCLKNLWALKEILKQNQTTHRYSCTSTLRMILTQQDCHDFIARQSQLWASNLSPFLIMLLTHSRVHFTHYETHRRVIHQIKTPAEALSFYLSIIIFLLKMMILKSAALTATHCFLETLQLVVFIQA